MKTIRLLLVSILALQLPAFLPAASGASRAAAGTAISAEALAGSRWAFKIPSGGAGWIGFTKENGATNALLLWGGGHPLPVTVATKEGTVEIRRTSKSKSKKGKDVTRIDIITARQSGGNTLAFEMRSVDGDGKAVGTPVTFTATRIPELPPAPDLSKLKYGQPVSLIGGNLSNWESMNPNDYNGWTLKDGVLTNTVVFPDGTKKRGANLRTVDKSFKDFRLTFEVNLPPGSNSGVYLRGIYEIQMADTHGKPPHHQNMGALYGRIAPSRAVEKKAGEWQTLDITLADRHVTVILNGVKIIDNQPVLGCTGGAITSDEFVPGPIYLQGDHTNASYRNMVLTPIVKDLR